MVNPIESTIHFQTPEMIEKVLANQLEISKLISLQNSLFDKIVATLAKK